MNKNPDGLSDKEVLRLFREEKVSRSAKIHTLSEPRFSIDLVSRYGSDSFMLDFSRTRVVFSYKYQLRAENRFPIVRLDYGGSFHDNPVQDCECSEEDPFAAIHPSCVGRHFAIGEPHIHYYREGYEDSWAYPVPDSFTNLEDMRKTFEDFMVFCNVTGKPVIGGSLDEFL